MHGRSYPILSATAADAFPSPLGTMAPFSGEGARRADEGAGTSGMPTASGRQQRASQAFDVPAPPYPHPYPSPRRERGIMASVLYARLRHCSVRRASPLPSPLGTMAPFSGEGARRADEGTGKHVRDPTLRDLQDGDSVLSPDLQRPSAAVPSPIMASVVVPPLSAPSSAPSTAACTGGPLPAASPPMRTAWPAPPPADRWCGRR